MRLYDVLFSAIFCGIALTPASVWAQTKVKSQQNPVVQFYASRHDAERVVQRNRVFGNEALLAYDDARKEWRVQTVSVLQPFTKPKHYARYGDINTVTFADEDAANAYYAGLGSSRVSSTPRYFDPRRNQYIVGGDGLTRAGSCGDPLAQGYYLRH